MPRKPKSSLKSTASTRAKTQPLAKNAPAASSAPAWIVRRSRIQGRGVFATRNLRKGERILEYTGERIGHEEAGRRYDDEAMERHHTFLFSVDENTCIDGGRIGNEARYINHSCEPNCVSRNVRKRIFVHALRPIVAGEELNYDYAYELEGPITMADVRRYPCLCGKPSCRGTMLAPRLIEEAVADAAKKAKARAKKKAAKKALAPLPHKHGAAKKPAAKKPTAKKPVAKKPAAKKPAAKKPAAKKPAAKKPAAKKPAAKKTGR